MKVSEEKYLKSRISKIKKYTLEYPSVKGFYENLALLNELSLQDLSFKTDLELFDEFGLILSVITTIVSNPRISNRNEETILRADQAGAIQNDMFESTMRDASLWKRKNLEMVPEYVHYHEVVDDIRIYENVFIGHLINMIDIELGKYMNFYISILQKFDGQSRLTYSKDNEEMAISRIESLDKRIKRLKNTYFYREVSKAKIDMSHITPTNILLKNRLYNMCFKFYKKMITYEDRSHLMDDFILFYYINLIKQLNNLGFKLTTKGDIVLDKRGSIDLYKPLTFKSDKFKIVIRRHDAYEGIVMDVSNLGIKGSNYSHLLLVDPLANFEGINRMIKTGIPSLFSSVEGITLWNMAYINDSAVAMFDNVYSEDVLISKWILSKCKETLASYKLYSFYCPICRNKNVDEKDEVFRCRDCDSIYTFYSNKDEDRLWFIKIGR